MQLSEEESLPQALFIKETEVNLLLVENTILKKKIQQLQAKKAQQHKKSVHKLQAISYALKRVQKKFAEQQVATKSAGSSPPPPPLLSTSSTQQVVLPLLRFLLNEFEGKAEKLELLLPFITHWIGETKDVELLLLRSKILYSRGKYKLSLEDTDLALQMRYNTTTTKSNIWTAVLYQKALSLFSLAKFQESLTAIQSAIKAFAHDDQYAALFNAVERNNHLILGSNIYLLHGRLSAHFQHSDANQSLLKSLQLNCRNVESLEELTRLSDCRSTKRTYIEQLLKFKTSSSLLVDLYYCYPQDPDQQLLCIERALQLDPTNAYCYFLMARHLSNQQASQNNAENLQKALCLYSKAVELDSNFGAAFNNRGNVYTMLQEPLKAQIDYHKAIKCNPRAITAYLNRAVQFLQLKNFKSAYQDLTTAVQLGSANHSHLLPLSVALRLQLGMQMYVQPKQIHKLNTEVVRKKALQDLHAVEGGGMSTLLEAQEEKDFDLSRNVAAPIWSPEHLDKFKATLQPDETKALK